MILLDMASEIYEKEFDKGVIEYGGWPICLVRKIQIAKFLEDGTYHVFMTKKYQNNNVEEHNEIDEKLMQIYEKGSHFTLNCYEEYYSCKLVEKPPNGDGRLSGIIL